MTGKHDQQAPTTASDSFYRESRRRISAAGSDKVQAPFYRAKLQKEGTNRLSAAMDTALAKILDGLDPTAENMARGATKEALVVLAATRFSRMPWIGIADDGVATLRWEHGEQGIALFFSGEGIFGLSKKTGPSDHYTTGYEERAVTEGLSENDIEDIVRLS